MVLTSVHIFKRDNGRVNVEANYKDLADSTRTMQQTMLLDDQTSDAFLVMVDQWFKS